MNLKQLIKFGLENSSNPVIKNPVLRSALEKPRSMDQASLKDELEPGPLRDEMLKDFDPSQETYEEYLQRKNLERPFNMAEGGQLVAPSVDGSRPGYGGTSELDKATKYFTDGEFTKFDDIKGFKSDDPNFKKYKKIRDRIRQNIKYHGGKFVEPGTTQLVEQKTIDLDNFLKNKKSIKQSVLIKKLEDLGYTNPKKYVNQVAFNNPNLEVIRDVEKIIPERESKIYSKKELEKATKGEHKKDPKRITKSTYDSLPAKEKALIRSKLLQHGGEYLGPSRQIKDPLPVDVQKEIKFKFAGDYKGTWDFDNFKYGIEGGKDKNSRLYDSIRNHVNEPKQWRYAGAQLNTPEGWMMAQMDRAYRQGNKNYKPIYRTIGGTKKIVGFIDNTEAGGGKKYISAKEFIKGSDADGVLFKGHVDYANTKKFNNIAQKVHGSPSKVITDILSKGGVEMFTESGKAKVQLKHVLNYLIDTKGLDKTTGGIVRHHKGSVFGNPTQDLQILNKVINSKITGIEDRIRADNILPEDVAKLKKWGASVTHKGVTYGGGPKTAIGGLKEIENLILTGSKDVDLYGREIRGIEQWKKQDFNKFKDYLKKLCPKGKASGGRIGFATGTPTVQCGANELNRLLKQGKGNTPLVKKILQGGGNFLKEGIRQLNPKEVLRLRNLIGPTALGFMAAYEGGVITDDVLRKGIPLNESVAKNWLTKSFVPFSEEFARQKNLLQSGTLTDNQRIYALDMMKAEKAFKEMDRIEGMKSDQLLEQSGYGMIDESQIVTDEAIEDAEANVNRILKDLDSSGSLDNTGMQMENIRAMDEMEASRMAKKEYSKLFGKWGTPLVNKLATPPRKRTGPMTAKKEMNIDYSLPTYDRMPTPTDQDILNYYRQSGIISPTEFKKGVLQPGEGTLIRMMQGGEGLYGSQFAGGGIAGIRRPHAIPPKSGPTPQGLPSMLNRVRRI